jgi:hypothetical protein
MSAWNIGALLLIAVGVFSIPYLSRKKELRRLSERDSLQLEELYARYYADSGLSRKSFLEVWNKIADTLAVPAEKLRPADRFGEDIGVYVGVSDKLDTLSELAHERAERRRIQVRLETLATVDDYVRTLAEPRSPGSRQSA